MSVKQQLKDFSVRLKGERKIQVISGLVVISLLALFFMDNSPKRPRRGANTSEQTTVGAGALNRNAFPDMTSRFDMELEALRVQSAQTAEDSRQIRKSLTELEERTAEVFRKIIERMDATSQMQSAAVGGGYSYPEAVNYYEDQMENITPDTLDSFGLDDSIDVAPPVPPLPARLAVVGAGDSVRVRLLAGVNAPTDGTPYPVVFQLVGDVYGPDNSALPLGEARLIAAAQGSLSDSRALFRLTSLNLRFPNGKREVVNVDGWIVGEDGIRGMEGVLIDPIGKAIAGAGMTGALAGLGESIAGSQTTVRSFPDGSIQEVITGDHLTFAAGKAASSASSEWGAIIRDRIRLLVPHVKVLSGREATAVFSRSFTISGLYEALEDDYYGFDSLD
jgi:hypothetical protein